MTCSEKRRGRGRPHKVPPAGKPRTQLTLLVRADIKRAIIKSAEENGRTLSAEGEAWLERLLAYDDAVRMVRAQGRSEAA